MCLLSHSIYSVQKFISNENYISCLKHCQLWNIFLDLLCWNHTHKILFFHMLLFFLLCPILHFYFPVLSRILLTGNSTNSKTDGKLSTLHIPIGLHFLAYIQLDKELAFPLLVPIHVLISAMTLPVHPSVQYICK